MIAVINHRATRKGFWFTIAVGPSLCGFSDCVSKSSMILPRHIADAAADLVDEANVEQNRSLITAAEDFANMLEVCPGAFINIGNAGAVGSYPVHNPHHDFNDAALPMGASLFARRVEKKLARLSGS
jgi:hippurate hydrolase